MVHGKTMGYKECIGRHGKGNNRARKAREGHVGLGTTELTSMIYIGFILHTRVRGIYIPAYT